MCVTTLFFPNNAHEKPRKYFLMKAKKYKKNLHEYKEVVEINLCVKNKQLNISLLGISQGDTHTRVNIEI